MKHLHHPPWPMKAMGTTHKSQQRSQSTPQAWKHIKTWNCNLLQSHCVFFRNVLNVCLQKKRHLACTDCHAIWLQKKTNHDAYVWNTFTRTIGSLDLQSKVVAQCQPWPRVIQHQTGLCNSIRKKPSHETSSNQWIHCWLVDCPVFFCMEMALRCTEPMTSWWLLKKKRSKSPAWNKVWTS